MDDKSERGRGGRFEAKRRIADTHTQIKMEEEEEEGEMNCNGGRAEEQVNGGIGGGGGKEREREEEPRGWGPISWNLTWRSRPRREESHRDMER